MAMMWISISGHKSGLLQSRILARRAKAAVRHTGEVKISPSGRSNEVWAWPASGWGMVGEI